MKVRANMSRDVVCVARDDSLKDAYDVMMEQDFRHLAVVEGTRLVGVLSHRDILLLASLEGETVVVPDLPVEHAMSEDLVTCLPTAEIGDVATIMIDRKINCLPVVTGDDELVGVITATDLLELLRARESAARQTLPFKFSVRYPTNRTRLPVNQAVSSDSFRARPAN